MRGCKWTPLFVKFGSVAHSKRFRFGDEAYLVLLKIVTCVAFHMEKWVKADTPFEQGYTEVLDDTESAKYVLQIWPIKKLFWIATSAFCKELENQKRPMSQLQ